jgi:hypothetical protein
VNGGWKMAQYMQVANATEHHDMTHSPGTDSPSLSRCVRALPPSITRPAYSCWVSLAPKLGSQRRHRIPAGPRLVPPPAPRDPSSATTPTRRHATERPGQPAVRIAATHGPTPEGVQPEAPGCPTPRDRPPVPATGQTHKGLSGRDSGKGGIKSVEQQRLGVAEPRNATSGLRR